jgi:signal transduction histidine kinase
VDNAVRAGGPDGHVIVNVQLVGGRLALTVEDDGPGFGLIERRTNLGLAVAEQVVAQAGGDLTVGSSADLGGAAVRLSVPEYRRVDEELPYAYRAV